MNETGTLLQPEQLRDDVLAGVAGGRYTGPVFMYTMQAGDNLSTLAHRFGTTVRILQELNGITNSAMLKAGSSLMIPQR